MKFCGKIGFYTGDTEVKPGVYKQCILERKAVGDVLRAYRKFQETEYQNDTLKINSQISVLSDLYFYQNWMNVRYVIWNGAKLKVTSVDISNYPRINLEVGGVYNGTDEITTSE